MNSSLITRHSSLVAAARAALASLLLAVLACAGVLAPMLCTGCATPVNQRTVAGQTLKTAGQAAEAAVAISARLYADKRMSPTVARAVLDFYNDRWQPAYRLALAAAQSDPAQPAPVQLLALLGELQGIVAAAQNLQPSAP